MNRVFVLGLCLLTVIGSGCATRGYARRQAAAVNDRTSQVQNQITALSAKQEADFSHVNQRLNTADNKLQEAAMSAAQASVSAAQANASAARADASAAQSSATAARAEATNARADAATARAAAAAAEERAVIAQNTAPPVESGAERTADRVELPKSLPRTGSPLPLIGLSGLISLVAGAALRLFRQ